MDSFLTCEEPSFGRTVCRLGLASRGQSALMPDDVLGAISAGVNFLNWPGASEGPAQADVFSRAIAGLGRDREALVVCVQLAARDVDEAAGELRSVLATLKTDYIDVVTLYYVEEKYEWDALCAPGGGVDYLRDAQRDGVIRRLGITSHQRPIAAHVAGSGLVDCLMVRYNAAHRGAENDVFPVTDALQIPVIAYTALRWGALGRSTPDDPPGYRVPPAPDWYRFVLESDSVAVVLAAPTNRRELQEDLQVLLAPRRLAAAEFAEMKAHGDRVRAHAGAFR